MDFVCFGKMTVILIADLNLVLCCQKINMCRFPTYIIYQDCLEGMAQQTSYVCNACDCDPIYEEGNFEFLFAR